ncbi:hypothetical protein K458DRAFT_317698 [Lentithecium fluviatile CBS 122367]|uniref:Zn(2)-C6 fungal-type domain-containing protein n=1 Tax=Lentithecium fluviatile CBS 122367 TaxID=1168545 RepID=A0A6G1IJ81_9PLEO|nr:hypothetical protein K458DRAFT_317698 [Lentithecium fluviatile CBS 122367]
MTWQAMSSASSTTRVLDLEALIQSLPACKRCRDCRRGCDTLLPKCKQCTKAGADCIFYDHGRNEYLPRSYIAGLVDHVRRLTARTDPSPAASGGPPQEPSGSAPVKAESVVSDANPHFDHHFAYAGDSYRYLGSESCLVKSPRLAAASEQIPFEDDDDDVWHLSFRQSRAKEYELIEVYLESIQPLYPILDLSARYLSQELPADLTDSERFHLNMVYAIACHVMPSVAHKKTPLHPNVNPSSQLSLQQKHAAKYQIIAASQHANAMEYLEAATSESSIDTLRSVLLLAIYSLFDPKNGNIGQQMALATRLALMLESQIDTQDLGSNDAETMRNMHSTIFSIENEIASTLDRPATFPEPHWELCFGSPQTRPADYLCSLYRLQHRFRKGDFAAKEAVKKFLPPLDEQSRLIPGLRMALHQTHMLLNPCWGTAWYVLEAVVSLGSIHIFPTPHWVYRAGALLIEYLPDIYPENLIHLYANALVVLALSSCKWPSSAALSASLSDLMLKTKAKHRPDWAGKLTLFDLSL